MSKEVEMLGKRFGRLVVVAESPERKNNQICWLCKCDCGNFTEAIMGGNLRSGHTKSCGCQKTKHGKRNTRLYQVWHGMKKRCYCKTDQAYSNYGERGINICNEWRNSFQAFYEWAMTNGYNPSAKQGECTLDRIDVNGNYCPENCRWVTMKIQQNNRRNNVQRKGA